MSRGSSMKLSRYFFVSLFTIVASAVSYAFTASAAVLSRAMEIAFPSPEAEVRRQLDVHDVERATYSDGKARRASFVARLIARMTDHTHVGAVGLCPAA